MDDLYRALGGIPGILGLAAAAAALFWRIKVPQIGLDYMQRELERNRNEIAIADRDRQTLRAEVLSMKRQVEEMEGRYLGSLADRERLAQALRRAERQLKEAGLWAEPREGGDA